MSDACMPADPSDPAPELQTLTGVVVRRTVDMGTKSERQAIVFECPEGTWPLRRRGGPALGDSLLETWVGRSMTVRGWVRPSHFLVDEVISPAGA